MRRLMWFTIGFAGACAVGIYLVSGWWLLLLGVFSLAAAIALGFLRSNAARITFWTLIGCTVGLVWLYVFDLNYLAPARSSDGADKSLQITVSDYSYETDFGVAADGETRLAGKTYQVRVYLPGEEPLRPGDTVSGQFSLRYTGFGGKKDATYHQGKGIFLLAYGDEDAKVNAAETIDKTYFAVQLRQQILSLLDSAFPADTLAFARALLLGDSVLLTYKQDTDFRVSGIRHVIAVSGLHVSILFSFVYVLCRKRRVLTALLGIPVLLLFAAVAGFTPSVVRACIMQGLMILALLCNREYDPPTALAFSVLAQLCVNPVTITSVSLQLSAGCMVGIFLFAQRIHDYLMIHTPLGPAKGKGIKARLSRWICGSVSVTLSAMIATTPLCAIYFGAVSLIGILTNLLTLWAISFIFYGIMAAVVAAAVWLPAGSAMAWGVSWLMRGVMWIAGVLSDFPLAAVYTESQYIILWLVMCYVLLTVFLLSQKKHPWLLTGCVTVGLCAALAASWMEPCLDTYRFTVLDVGQGQCLLIQSQGRIYMVDCGGDNGDAAADKAAQHLLSQGITKLDGLLLTHYDTDHAGGVAQLLTRIPADRLYLPKTQEASPLRDALAEAHGEKIQWIDGETSLFVEGGWIDLFPAAKEETESSMCILFRLEKCDILITGDRDFDGERALLETNALPDIEILVAGHHGSKYATGLELLHATMPESVVISVGADNSYGHPAKECLQRLELFGCRVWRTDKDGTITFRG